MKRAKKYNNRNPYAHTFDLGSWTKEITNPDGSKKTVLTGAGIGGIATQAAGFGSKLLAGKNETGVGNAMSALGNVASMIPGPYGAIIGGGLNVLGNITNAAFGSNLNQEFINDKNNEIISVASEGSSATNANDFMSDWANRRGVGNFSKSDIGSDGWFSNKAKNKYNEMLAAASVANQTQTMNFLNQAHNINEANSRNMLNQLMAFGGPLHSYGADWTNGLVEINAGGTHEQNPYDGVPMGIAEDGEPNLVEEGEVVYNDYVFSKRLRVPKAVREKYKLRGTKDLTFADAAKKAQKESEERPNDPISKRGLEDIMNKLTMEQEQIRAKKAMREVRKAAYGGELLFSNGGKIHIKKANRGKFTEQANRAGMGVQEYASHVLANKENYPSSTVKRANFARNASKWKHDLGGHLFKGTNPFNTQYMSRAEAKRAGLPVDDRTYTTYLREEDDDNKYNPLTVLRFAPVLGAGIGVLTDALGWTNKPDYSNADSILNTARSETNRLGDVSFTPVGEYLAYSPFDRLFYANQLGSQVAATRRAILNGSNNNIGAAMAGLLAADYNAQEQLGKLYRQGEEYNLAQRQKVADFNRATDMFNSEGDLKAQMANADRDAKRASLLVGATEKSAALRDAENARANAARSANFTSFLQGLGDIGREEVEASWVKDNPYFLYGTSRSGRGINYKALGFKYNPETGKRIEKNGGYLTIKDRRKR